jgi:phenylalanyl-tRNA synthetase beta chain
MKISYNWICSYLSVKPEVNELEKILTSCGLEVENYTKEFSVKGGLSGLVVGYVTSCIKHPGADKLSLTRVDVGNEEQLQIVCGAPNVAEGQKVVVAKIGTTLFPTKGEPFEIKKTKIRGEISEGMICAEDEIGIGNSHDGIIVLPNKANIGATIASFYGVEEDYIFEIGLTPNRVDAASHIGVARDVVAVLSLKEKIELIKPEINSFSANSITSKINIEVQDTNACPRYSGIQISNITIAESPTWLKNKLKFIGLKPINNIVDITNFVLHETGQPLHAFDADKIDGNKVIVKTLADNTVFETLDGVQRKLSSEDLMICNENEAMCIAGVFGGNKSGITNQTKNIFLESAYFNPTYIRKTSKKHSLFTDASFRYERGADPNNTIYALKRACLLIQEIAGGIISSPITDIYPTPIPNHKVFIEYDFINKLTGKKISNEIQKLILEKLEIIIENQTENEMQLSVPPFKVDVTRKVDVAEEILRIYGYDNIEIPTQLHATISLSKKPDKQLIQQKISLYLASLGFSEILTNSLSNSSYYENDTKNVKILNALSSELETLRSTMLFGGLESISYNFNRRNFNLKFFEFGKVYEKNETQFKEAHILSLFITGSRFNESWNNIKVQTDIFELKGFLSNIFTLLNISENLITVKFNNQHIYLQDTLVYTINEKIVAYIGSVKQALLTQFDIDKPIYYLEIDFDNLLLCLTAKTTKYKGISKFIGVRRDLAILFDKHVLFSEIKDIAFKSEKKILKNVQIFDVYEGKNIENDKKSYAIAFYLHNELATLTDKEIENSMQKIQTAIEQNLGGKVRA